MAPSIRIKTLQKDRVVELAGIYLDAFTLADENEKWSLKSAEELIRFFLEKQSDLVFVAESGDRLVGGVMGIVKPWWDGFHIVEAELFVGPKHQRKQIGTLLLCHFLKAAQSKYSAVKMESLTFKNTEFPSCWYSRLGFREKTDWKIIEADPEELLVCLGAGKAELRSADQPRKC